MRPLTSRRRLPDWPQRLDALVQSKLAQPFAWGSHDCCTWPADVVQAITGEDPIASYRGRYATEDEAEAVLTDGLEAEVAKCMAAFGAPECPPRFAQRGDWALCRVGNELLGGAVVGSVVMVPGMARLYAVPMGRVVRAWAV